MEKAVGRGFESRWARHSYHFYAETSVVGLIFMIKEVNAKFCVKIEGLSTREFQTLVKSLKPDNLVPPPMTLNVTFDSDGLIFEVKKAYHFGTVVNIIEEITKQMEMAVDIIKGTKVEKK